MVNNSLWYLNMCSTCQIPNSRQTINRYVYIYSSKLALIWNMIIEAIESPIWTLFFTWFTLNWHIDPTDAESSLAIETWQLCTSRLSASKIRHTHHFKGNEEEESRLITRIGYESYIEFSCNSTASCYQQIAITNFQFSPFVRSHQDIIGRR